MKHFNDCPHKDYNICTCDMTGEEIALVSWQIAKQKGQLKWWNVIAWLSTSEAPTIEKRL